MTNYLYEKLYMKKVVRLTESDLEKIVRKVISEQLSAGVTKGPDFSSRTYDSNNPGFEKFLNSIKAKLQSLSNLNYTEGKKPQYDAVVRDVAGLSTLTFDKNKKEWVESDKEGGLQTFKQREEQLMKFMDDVSKQVGERSKKNNYPFWVWAVTKHGGELLNGLQGKKNPTIVMDDLESIKQVPMPQPKVEVPSMVVNDKQIPVDAKFMIGSPVLDDSYQKELPTFLKQSFTKAVEDYRNLYKELQFAGQIYVSGIKVTSSSSRIPQDNMKNERYRTGPNGTPDGYKNLSQDRGKALLNSLLQFIKSDSSIITDVNTKISEVDFLGDNGDGTSGPEYDKAKGNDFYKQYQQAYITLEFAAIPTIPPTVKPEIKTVTDYSIRASGEGRKHLYIDLNLPDIKLPSFKIGGVITQGTGRDIACPVFRG
jgi:hypothetical protein